MNIDSEENSPIVIFDDTDYENDCEVNIMFRQIEELLADHKEGNMKRLFNFKVFHSFSDFSEFFFFDLLNIKGTGVEDQ